MGFPLDFLFIFDLYDLVFEFFLRIFKLRISKSCPSNRSNVFSSPTPIKIIGFQVLICLGGHFKYKNHHMLLLSRSVLSNSVQSHRRQPTRLLRPWDPPGKNTGVGCHFLLQCMKVKSESEVAQSCLTLSDPIGCSLPGSSIHGIF